MLSILTCETRTRSLVDNLEWSPRKSGGGQLLWCCKPFTRWSHPPTPARRSRICAVRAAAAAASRTPRVGTRTAHPREDEMVHRPAPKRRWHRHAVCMCGLRLDVCPDYRLQVVLEVLAR